MAPSVSLSTIQQTIARAIAQSPVARGRIERAAVLISLGAVEKIDESTYRVASQTDSGETYTVTPGGCDCVDARRRSGQRCKHQWAVRITLSAEIQERRERFAALTDVERAKLAEVKRRYVAA